MKILASRSSACCEPTVTTISSGCARTCSSAMTSQIRSRSPASPCAVQYCSATSPWSAISRPIMLADGVQRERGQVGRAAGQRDDLGPGGDGEQRPDFGGDHPNGAFGVLTDIRVNSLSL